MGTPEHTSALAQCFSRKGQVRWLFSLVLMTLGVNTASTLGLAPDPDLLLQQAQQGSHSHLRERPGLGSHLPASVGPGLAAGSLWG